MNEIYLPPSGRTGLRLWLASRGDVEGISRMRLVQFRHENADTIKFGELMALVDETGYGCLDAIVGRSVSAG